MAILLSAVLTNASFAATAGEEWTAIVSALSDAEKPQSEKDAIAKLQTAKTIYQNVFQNAALAVDTESDVLIGNAFSDSIEKITLGNIEQVSLNRQVIDKTIYKIAFMKTEAAIDDNNTEDFLYWFDVLDKKFKISSGDYQTNQWISEIKNDSSKLSENGPKITQELLGIFKLKTLEELEEAIAAIEANDLKSAKKFTYEGLYYYRTFHPAVEEKLGKEDANELLHEMEEAIKVTVSNTDTSKILEELEHITAEVELIIREYEGGDTSEIGLALSGIKDRLNLVAIEYAEAVKDGQIIDQEEYDETIVFLAKAVEIFNTNKVNLMELSNSDASSLEKNFGEINRLVTNKENPNQVTILVGKSLNNIASLEDYAGGAVEIDVIQYIDKIEMLLNQAKQEYRQGNTQIAFDLVSEAYLDNYEFVEGPLGEVDEELMEKIEVNMREELRSMIQSNSPVSEVDAQIDMILSDLESARMVVPEFGTIALLVLVISIVSVILLNKSRLNVGYRF